MSASKSTPENPAYTSPYDHSKDTADGSMSSSHTDPISGENQQDENRIGRTPDGKTFVVPETQDMVSQLFDPRQPHNISDGIVVAVNFLLIYALFTLPTSVRQSVAALMFFFWRGCYNVGIGWLLYKQSNSRLLTSWAKKTGIFETSTESRTWIQSALKTELEKKIPSDYRFEDAPLEYNTWLVFRKIVDLVLMCDFTSYCLFAIVCSSRPAGETLEMTATRWTVGIGLILFNIWVKRDAHRVVKDYAWYWGDFFYLTNAELTFDGVFKIFPHPMYSVGYIGYYGISLLAAAYEVLLVSVIAHTAQMVFLFYVETPHIEKTYPSPTIENEESNVNVWDLI